MTSSTRQYSDKMQAFDGCGGAKNRGSVEILLLLCCTVGIVAFMCFAISALNLGIMYQKKNTEEYVESPSGLQEMKNRQAGRVDYLRLLRERITEYRQRITRNEQLLARARAPEKNRRKLERYTRELNELEASIAAGENELADYSVRSTHIDKKQNETVADLENLKRRLRDVTEEIAHEKGRLQELADSPESALGDAVDSLRRFSAQEDGHITELENAIRDRRATDDRFDVRSIMKGTGRFANPLFAECRSDQVLLYPAGAAIGEHSLSSGNPFAEYAGVNDGIVFLVRPSGFDVFTMALSKARERGFRIGYEPVDADWRLDYGGVGK